MITKDNLKLCEENLPDLDDKSSYQEHNQGTRPYATYSRDDIITEPCARQQCEEYFANISFIASALIGAPFMLYYSAKPSTPCWLNTWATRRAQGGIEQPSSSEEASIDTPKTQQNMTLH